MTNNSILLEDMDYISSRIHTPEIFAGKTILITGCAGFIGFYLVNFFLHIIKNGVKVKSLILLDNFLIGRPKWIDYVESFGENILVKTFDISNDDISVLYESKQVDYIFHMASIASPTFYRKYPIQTVDANVMGLKRLLESYKNIHLEGFLFLSSSEIYGDPCQDAIPTDEEYRGNVSCIGPRACYDEAKRFGETLCYLYHNTYNMPIRIVRPFNNYGPGIKLDDRRVVADFAKSVLSMDDIAIYSDGSPKRTFCYIADAIVGYIKALMYNKFDYFNIGIDEPMISISELADLYAKTAEKLFGYTGRVVYKNSEDKDYLTHNPQKRCPDISKARRLLGFRPEIKVQEGINRFLKYLIEEGNIL